MEKQTTFLGHSEAGVFAYGLFVPMAKTARAVPGEWETADEIRKYIKTITPEDRKKYCYVLVNALGAGEYFGSNINADYFPWDALAHEGSDYGYKTFLNAHCYTHHVNKDPERSIGKPVVSVLNPRMKRVELIIRIDREAAKKQGADGIVTRIDNGEFPDVSMGCAPKGSPVLLADGKYVPIETVKEGDHVVSHRGVARRVASTMARPHKGEIFHIKAYGTKDPLVLTEEHPLWLLRAEQVACRPSAPTINNGRKQQVCVPNSPSLKKGCEGCGTKPGTEFAWVRADEAQVGDYLATPLPSFDTSRSFSSDEARLLGYYLSEGLVLRTKAGSLMAVQFCTGLHETETHTEIFAAANRLGFESVSEHDVEERNGKYITIYDKGFAALCLEHCGERSKTKRLSSSLMGAGEDVLQIFLGAYANGDGGCYKGSIYLSTASEQLAKQLRIVLLRCRMMASVNVIQHKPGPKSVVKRETTEYQVWVGTDSSWKFIGSRHAPERSKKLCSKRFFLDHDGVSYLVTPIEAIERVDYDDQVYNFGVETDDSYLMDGLAVHNCKVPFDVCTICGNESKTRDDYCPHMRPPEDKRGIWGPNKILEDGRKICVINTLPRFFDISFVFIGADKTAKAMAKLASKGAHVCLGPVCALPEASGEERPALYAARGDALGVGALRKTAGAQCDGRRGPCGRLCAECGDRGRCETEKLAAAFGVKQASKHKLSEIKKHIQADTFATKKLPAIEAIEPDLPRSVLHQMAQRPLCQACGSATSMGMVLKPHEFQRMVLMRMGQAGMADELDHGHLVFHPCKEFDYSIKPVFGPDPDLIKHLAPYAMDRSAFGPALTLRIIKTANVREVKKTLPTRDTVEHPLLDKISAAYNGYRRNVMLKLSQAQEEVVGDPQLRNAILGDELVMTFSKTASSHPILTSDSAAYMMGAHLSDRSLLASTRDAVQIAVANQWLLEPQA
jgi:hypothetical protein